MANKPTALNPNAAEFIPSAFRSPLGSAKIVDSTRLDIAGTSGKAVLDRSESSNSNYSDDEAHRFWRHQLPDDITPDFKAMGENELQDPGNLSLDSLSIHESAETLGFPVVAASQMLGATQGRSLGSDDLNLLENLAYSGSAYAGDHSSGVFMTSAASAWDEQFVNGDQNLIDQETLLYSGDSSANFLNDLGDQAALQDAAINPVDFLASQFPGFAAESLAEVYYANGCDLNLTIEILTQLELQVDTGFAQNLNSKTPASPNLSPLDFPALPLSDTQNGLSKISRDDIGQAPNTYRSATSIFGGATDFASAVRKLASQDSGQWKYERNGSGDGRIGSSRMSQLLASSQNGNAKLAYGDKMQSVRSSRAAPVWLETGEAVASMYSESREEARDFARLRNACFDQARQAYLIGNKALAKELSEKGQLYNIQMKAAHGKAREAIYRQRNPISSDIQSYGRSQERLIDLHGLHVSEAIHVLKHELSTLRSAARAVGRQAQVMICVGTGHHTKGSRTPARLPVAVEQYLLEENLHYTQPQPGLLRVVIY
ncbi:putative MutS-related protein involved in mismatch repair protein [Dioscorea alata]|uniref:MutS-related protein involved in mismatch repair protein n=3 Tax=Dioscorea alata TaxID=55571 RepID=A0ACB7U8A3_DIOAL|nr:putative MutS-related protein involved in mismatch repair protein [Dioscorea alata]KAH7656502.1 putative MutS-related protein involved in mismatch repair protein [Dioscorea alata]KAH7656504.1 putative MutS-related protein involved in mismatch repair protein [Dioscorea alata]